MKKHEQTKCSQCCIRFGEIDDEPIECEDCELLHCSQCDCSCGDEDIPEDDKEN